MKYIIILFSTIFVVMFFMLYVGPWYVQYGYLQSNHCMAYDLNSDWLRFFSSVFGGIHKYDFIVPVLLVLIYLFKLYLKKKDFSNDINKRHDAPMPFEREKRIVVLVFLAMLPLRIIYFSLYVVNYYTAGPEEVIEYPIRCSSYLTTRDGHRHTFSLYVNIEDDIPYQLETSEENFNNFNNGKLTKAIVHVRKGCMNYRFASKYEFKE